MGQEAFWSKVDKNGPLIPGMATQCWPWKGARTPDGYGKFYVSEFKKDVMAHRFAYALCAGPPPPLPIESDHLCRNRACVNPEHIEFVTRRENQIRGVGFVAVNAAKTHCASGHEFTHENTYFRKGSMRRDCRACGRMRVARYKAKTR